MKKGVLFIMTAVFIFGSALYADAVFVPSRSDLFDLDHYYAYTWGIDLGFSTADTPITGAVLTFTDIANWRVEEDHLFVHLLDEASVNPDLVKYWDGQGGGDYFLNQGVMLIDWDDPAEGNTNKELDIVFDADQLALLNAYGANGIIGFGLDPDCHYYNSGVSFKIITAAVPTPGAIMLGTMGLMVVGWLRSRRSF